jgi:hypothetical protein
MWGRDQHDSIHWYDASFGDLPQRNKTAGASRRPSHVKRRLPSKEDLKGQVLKFSLMLRAAKQ